MPVLTVKHISKNYGRIQALDDVSLEVPEGCVFGILGPNGSGKTTLLGVVLDVLKPSKGHFLWFDQPASHDQRKHIGTLLETPNFYHYLSGERNLAITAAIKGHGEQDVTDALEKVNLLQRRHSKFSSYSLGMKQRLGLASALLGNPHVLVLDEPTNGLDPVGIAETRALIRQLAGEGKTIILASHLLDEVEKVCTHVAILQQGKLIAAGTVDDVLVGEDIVELAAADNGLLITVLQKYKAVKSLRQHQGKVQLIVQKGFADLADLNSFCFQSGVVLHHLRLKRQSLETKFFELTSGNPS